MYRRHGGIEQGRIPNSLVLQMVSRAVHNEKRETTEGVVSSGRKLCRERHYKLHSYAKQGTAQDTNALSKRASKEPWVTFTFKTMRKLHMRMP